MLPVASRQTFPYKYTFLTDSNASLWLFSSVNYETFLEIYLAKINNIFRASNRLLTKITQKLFSETFKHTYNYQEKMAQVFPPPSINWALSRTHPEVILGNLYSLILNKIDLNREKCFAYSYLNKDFISICN